MDLDKQLPLMPVTSPEGQHLHCDARQVETLKAMGWVAGHLDAGTIDPPPGDPTGLSAGTTGEPVTSPKKGKTPPPAK